MQYQARRQLAEAIVVAEATGTLEARAALETEADDLYPVRQRRVNCGEVEP